MLPFSQKTQGGADSIAARFTLQEKCTLFSLLLYNVHFHVKTICYICVLRMISANTDLPWKIRSPVSEIALTAIQIAEG